MDSKAGSTWIEKREYPRIKADCPVRYKLETDDTWQIATMIDYSATGVRIKCEELIFKGTKIRIEVEPGSVKNIPAFTAEGIAVRFALDEDHNYQIACEFNKPVTLLIKKPSC